METYVRNANQRSSATALTNKNKTRNFCQTFRCVKHDVHCKMVKVQISTTLIIAKSNSFFIKHFISSHLIPSCCLFTEKNIFLPFFTSHLNIFQIQTTIFNLSLPV